MNDLKFALRSALRAPLFSILAIVTLALGIGANAALFAVVKPVMLDPLPYSETDRLVRIGGHNPAAGAGRWGISAGMVDDLRRSQRSFAEVAASQSFTQEVVVGGAEGARAGTALIAEPNLFRVLGVEPQLGRLAFADDELPTVGPGLYMVLSHDAWQRFANGDPDIVGKQIPVFERPRTVIGVLPRGFIGPYGNADLYLPLNIPAALQNPVTARRSYSYSVLARLAPGATLDGARAELATLGEVIQRQNPEDVRGVGFSVQSLRTAMVGDTRVPLLILLASAALVLVIACANLAGAMLSRALARRKEFAVRSALGAGRAQLVRQMLTESSVLALAGGVLGVVLALVALTLVRDLVAPTLPHFASLSLDAGTLLTVMLVTIVAGIAVGLLPALVVGAHPQRAMVEQTRGATESRSSGRLRGALVAAQIAVCLALLVSAGLLTRSLWGMATAPVGVDADRVVTARTTLPFIRYSEPERIFQFHETLIERVRALPGMTAAATAVFLPQGSESSNTFEIEGSPWEVGQAEPWANWNAVSDDYFTMLRVPLLQGRTFDSRDGRDTQRVIVISDAMARRHFPNGDALGARVRIGPDIESPRWEVIGVVGDVRNSPDEVESQPMTYMSHRQEPVGYLRVIARTAGDPHAALTMIERELAAIDPALPFQEPRTLDAVFASALAPRRLPVLLMVGFGGLALLLAGVGVYAMFATMAAAREREIGIRVALGATRAAIARMVVRTGALWLGVGVLFGIVATAVAGAALRDLLYGVAPFDPVTLGAAAAVLAAVAAVALAAPVRRATRVDPIQVMRSE